MTDRIAVVTGAARDIGLATARLLARKGFGVHLVDIDRDQLEEVHTSDEIQGQALGFHEIDLSEESGVRELIASLGKTGPRICALVNNAFRHSRSDLVTMSTRNRIQLIRERQLLH